MNTEEIEIGFRKKKKMILIAIIIAVILFIFILFLWIFLNYKESLKLKYVLDDKIYNVNISTSEGTDSKKGSIVYNNTNYDLFYVEGEDYYFNINTLCELTGYKYNKGEYGNFSESTDKCYIVNEGEYSSFALDSNIITKQLYKSGEKDFTSTTEDENEIKEIYSTDKNVKKIDNKLYASAEAISIGFNMQVTSEGNKIKMYKLPYLVDAYTKLVTQKGYTGVSSDFKNQRALTNGLVVVQENDKYGVYSIENDSEVISAKYDSLEYIGNINQFIGTVSGKMGMVSPTSEELTIKLEYDSIELLDSEDVLYLVAKDNKYGVISGEGKIIVPIQYSNIGFKDTKNFSEQSIDSKYMLFDECIVVVSNDKYGLYSKDGKVIKEAAYDGLGCTTASKVVQSQEESVEFKNTLVVDYSKDNKDVHGVVFEVQDKYGIITTDGDVIVPSDWDAIFYIKNGDNIDYYLASSESGIVITLKEYLNIGNVNE